MPRPPLARRHILQGAAAVSGATALAALHGPPFAHAADESERHSSVLGTWRERVTPNAFPPFEVLITFGAGGGLTASSSGDLTPGTLSGPVHGTWARTGPRAFSWFGLAFAFDAQGVVLGHGVCPGLARQFLAQGESWHV
jgi:hypothetical protein